MDPRIAVTLTAARLKDSPLHPLGQPQAVDGTTHRCFRRLDRVVLVMRWRRRAGQIIDLIDLVFEGVDDVVTYEFEIRIRQKVRDVRLLSREQIVDAHHFVTVPEQTLAEMGTEKA